MVRAPKPSGGARLLGLMNFIVRVWGRCRFRLTRQWELEHQSDIFWGGMGRSTSRAVFHQNIDAEMQCLQGGHAATALYDLWKAYEQVVPEVLWQEALAAGFPAKIVGM
eukprot:1335169-Lingulodinium_polyedra.AAC.1